MARILLVGGIKGAAHRVLDYRHIVSIAAAGEHKLALAHPGLIRIARDRILRRLGDRNEGALVGRGLFYGQRIGDDFRA